MAANTHGVSYFTYNVPVQTGLVLNAYTDSRSANIDVRGTNEYGREVFRLVDDVKREITLEGLVSGSASFTVGTVVTLSDSTKAVVDSVEVKRTNNGIATVTAKLTSSEYLTLA